jgi:hypothetical protein
VLALPGLERFVLDSVPPWRATHATAGCASRARIRAIERSQQERQFFLSRSRKHSICSSYGARRPPRRQLDTPPRKQ